MSEEMEKLPKFTKGIKIKNEQLLNLLLKSQCFSINYLQNCSCLKEYKNSPKYMYKRPELIEKMEKKS